MRVSKWGNALAIRIPKTVVQALQLKDGDDVEITVAGMRRMGVDRDRRREDALATLRGLARAFPPGWKFDRDAANQRDLAGDPQPRANRSRTRRRPG